MSMIKSRAVALVGAAGLGAWAATAHAQTIYSEIEPNNTKAEALANGPFILGAGDGISGLTTGNTAGGTDPANFDIFLVQTAPLAEGLYRHRLVLSSPTAGHTATIRGLNQPTFAAGVWPCTIGIPGATDSTAQTGQIVSGDRIVSWYGFGRGERIYYRVAGAASTTGQYTAILETQPLAIQDIGTWQAGQITISTAPPGHGNDCDMIVYDEFFQPIQGYSNDGASINGGHTSNTNVATFLRREYAPGTYYLAISAFDLSNNLGSPCDDNRRTGIILDFEDAVVSSNATAPFHVHFNVSDAWGGVQINSTRASAFEVRWHKFTAGEVLPGACCLPNMTCEIRTAAACAPASGLYLGDGTDCSLPCPPPGACCLANGTCSVMAAGVCAASAGGVFQGGGTTCTSCPAQPEGEWFGRASAPAVRVGAAGGVIAETFYLIGGSPANGIRDTNCWKFDILNNAWAAIAPLPHSGAALPQLGGISNMDATAFLGGGGQDVYIVGGWPGDANLGPLSRVLRYDTLGDYWEEQFSDPYPTPSYAAALAVHDGKIYALGGHTALNSPTSNCFVYDPAAPAGTRWTSIAPLDIPRAGMAAIAIGGKIYAVGGEATDQDRVDVYDISTNTWSAGPNMMMPRGGTAIYDLHGEPYAASGGWTTYQSSGEILEGGVTGAWVAGPSVINGLRSMAYGGNETWLVRSTGFDGAYRAYTETMRLGPGTPVCYANCDGSTTPPILNVDDFTCFINEFAAASQLPHEQQIGHYANCDGSTVAPVLNVDDFTCFINAFAQGCR